MNTNQTLRQATLAKWSTIFQKQQSSGLTIKEWCLQKQRFHLQLLLLETRRQRRVSQIGYAGDCSDLLPF